MAHAPCRPPPLATGRQDGVNSIHELAKGHHAAVSRMLEEADGAMQMARQQHEAVLAEVDGKRDEVRRAWGGSWGEGGGCCWGG